jgi:23S rRNA (uracil1939-C5)-methyltransferase
MVQFFKPKPKAISPKAVELTIDSLDHHLTGVGRIQGKACFVEHVLPQERVLVQITEQKKQVSFGQLKKILQPSPERQTPFCAVADQCGGCNAQMIPLVMQQQSKVVGVRQLFSKLAKIELPDPECIISGAERHYRRVTRLAVKYDKQKKRIQLGFRQKQNQQIVEIRECPVLTGRLSALLVPLRQLLMSLATRREIGHLELYDTESGITILFRFIDAITEADRQLLLEFGAAHASQIYVQTCDTPEALVPDAPLPFYEVPDVRLHYAGGDFIQVNPEINLALVDQVLSWLAPTAEDRVLDLFCGIGNFSLPLARRAKAVCGIEGVPSMVARASENAKQNQIANAAFYRADLTKIDEYSQAVWAQSCYDLILLDPGRSGAADIMSWLAKSQARRIVYVSCNPVTAARDCFMLQSAYNVKQWGVFDMFPHTGHIESLFLFERKI